MQFRFFAGVAPLGVEQSLRQVENQCGGPHIAEMSEAHIFALADDAGVARNRRSNEVRAKFENGIVIEVRTEPFFGKLDSIAFNTREADFQRVSVGTDSLDLNRL